MFSPFVCGDFLYTKYYYKTVSLIGLAKDAQEKETIVFPTTIYDSNDKTTKIVEKVGSSYLDIDDVLNLSGPIVFKNNKNIYIPSIMFKTRI